MLTTVEHLPEAADWQPRLTHWGHRLRAAHVHGIVGALLDVLEPLGPFGAHLLLVAQPTLGIFVPRAEIASLARVLDAPGGMVWLRTQLTDSETKLEHSGVDQD